MSEELDVSKLNIYQRINEVRKKIEYLKKEKQVQGYKVITHDEVTGALRDHLIEFGVIVVPRELESEMINTGTLTVSGTPWMRFEAKYDVCFVNVDNPEDMIPVTISAHALDMGDKAPGKCLSYATKAAMLKLFSIETGEDDEKREAQKPAAEKVDLKKTIELGKALERHKDSIEAIKHGIMTNDLSAAAEAWFEMDNDEMQSIWVAPTKGGPFTTDERTFMKSNEFRVAYYGEAVEQKEEKS